MNNPLDPFWLDWESDITFDFFIYATIKHIYLSFEYTLNLIKKPQTPINMKLFRLLISVLILGGFFYSQMSWSQNKSENSFNYISPVPGSKYINPENNIAFRNGDVLDMSSIRSSIISVTGLMRGEITGTLKLSNDSRTLIFIPDQPFAYNETITVNLKPGIQTESGLLMEGLEFNFHVKPADNSKLLHEHYQREYEENISILPVSNSIDKTSILSNDKIVHGNIKNREGLPTATIVEYNNPAQGFIFCSPE